MASPESTRPIRVWDLPTRVFHGLLVIAVGGALWTSLVADSMVWHGRFGLATLGLLIFRIVWGLVGGHWSRFSQFRLAPNAVLRHLRPGSGTDPSDEIGHNPLGSWSVVAILGIIALQVATGLVADDEIDFTGPLNAYVDGATAEAATTWHRTGGEWILFGLLGLHLAAIAFYRWVKGRRLVAAMWHGDQQLPASSRPSADGPQQRWLALAIAAVCAAIAFAIGRIGD